MFSVRDPFSPKQQAGEHAQAIVPPTDDVRKRRRQDDAIALVHDIQILVRQVVKALVVDFAKLTAVQPCPHSHLDAPTTIVSLCPIPRARLPLAWLDPRDASSLLPGSRFISAHIPDLEGEASQATSTPTVLIARPKFRDDLYAIERIRTGVYTSCRLASWVKVSHIGLRATSSDPLPILPRAEHHDDKHSGEWWQTAAKTRVASTEERFAKRRKLSKSAAEDGPVPILLPQQSLIEESTASSYTVTDQAVAGAEDGEAIAIPQASPHEMVSSLVTQYLETLYLSNASLAFFAKGPLSRARTQFTTCECLEQLPKALRDLVLPIAVTDKRYKETITDVIKQQLASMDVQERVTPMEPAATTKTNRRKQIKAKWSKDGTLPGEAEYIGKWWLATDVLDSSKSEVRTRLSGLRFRETLLQLILILEALAIESSLPLRDACADTGTAQSGTEELSSKPQLKPKPKKQKDLTSHAEALIDRLTIWLSVEAANDTDQAQKLAASDEFVEPVNLAENGDRLRDFCIDVVIPFYGSRLPTLVAELKQKMGLPSTPLARRRRIVTEETGKPARFAPGAALSRQDSTRKRLPLARVSSDTTRTRSTKPPSLLRSATDSFLHNSSTERSQTPRLPRTNETGSSVSRPGSRAGSIMNESKAGNDRHRRSLSRTSSMSQTLSNREVDTSIFAKFKQAKARQAALVEEEVRGAIANIKKPNRTLAVKEVVDDADARSKRLQRKSHLSVQVNATPRRARQQAIFSTPGKDAKSDLADLVLSTDPFIPASVMKLKQGSSGGSSLGITSSRTLEPQRSSPFGFQTPSRPKDDGLPSGRTSIFLETSKEIVPSSIMKGKSQAELLASTPTKLQHPKPQPQEKPFAVPATPAQTAQRIATGSLKDTIENDPNPTKHGEDSSSSIYAALGWDME